MPRISRALATGLALAALVFTSRAQADIYEQVPAEAMVVVKVANLQATSEKVKMVGEKLGLGLFVPQLADPLGSLQQQTGVTEGLDTSGDFGLVYVDPKAVELPDDRSMMMLIPVSDFDAFLKNLVDTRTEDGIVIGKFAQNADGEEVYVAHWGTYAAVARDKQMLIKKPEGLKLAGVAAKEVNRSDISMYANFTRIGPVLQPKLAEGRAEAMAEVENGLRNSNNPDAEKYIPLAKAAVNRLIDVADGFLGQSESVVVAINLNEVGIASTVLAEFKEGTYSETLVASLKNNDETFVQGMPEAKYIFIGGYAGNAEPLTKAADDLLAPIQAEIDKLGEDGEKINKAIGVYRKQIAATKTARFGLLAPAGMLQQDALFQGFGIADGDAATLAGLMREGADNQIELMKAMGTPEADMLKITYTEGGKTIGDVKLDMLKMEIDPEADTPAAANARDGFNIAYGAEGFTAYAGALDDDTFVSAIGVNDEQLAAFLDSARANGNAFSDADSFQVTAKQLPAARLGAGYLYLDNLAGSIMHYSGQMGFPVEVQLPPDLSPIGYTLASDGRAIRLDAFIPSDTIQAIVAAGFQAVMAAQQGRGGGGGL
jgi:hypothetical protein